jgi:predicted NAD-dependent protein-ADP-ribosyltransferase YbiA (DUF1768 family)
MSDPEPINISSAASEEIGRLMSNFGDTPFTLDGRRYASVESFYVCLKFLEEDRRRKIASLSGKGAYDAGKGSALQETEYQGRRFLLGGPEHHALIARAIRAKLRTHPAVAQAFAGTHSRAIIHDTGQPERPGTFMPAAAFCRILTALRDELVANGGKLRDERA